MIRGSISDTPKAKESRSGSKSMTSPYIVISLRVLLPSNPTHERPFSMYKDYDDVSLPICNIPTAITDTFFDSVIPTCVVDFPPQPEEKFKSTAISYKLKW